MPKDCRAWMPADLLWKGKTLALPAATTTILVLVLLCKGALSQTPRVELRVQQGLCVDIPCTFTYEPYNVKGENQLNGYWIKEGEGQVKIGTSWNPDNVKGRLVATSDRAMRDQINQSALNRFQLTGDLEKLSCSFRINDVRLEDNGTYIFKINGGTDLKYCNGATPLVLVTELTEKPQIQNSTEIVWGKPVTFTCQAPGTCSGTPPGITWTSPLGSRQGRSQSHQHNNGSRTYTSELTLTLTLADQGKPLTCLVMYPAVGATAEGTIYPPYQPKNMKIKPTINREGKVVQSSQEKVLVAQEGDSIYLLCQVEATPDPMLTWMKGNKTLGSPMEGKEYQLNLSKFHLENTGEYRCRAKNVAGSISMHVWLNMSETRYPLRECLIILIIPCFLKVLICFLFFGVMFWKEASSTKSSGSDG